MADRRPRLEHSSLIVANWKATMEVFLDGYHVPTTHPHTIRFANDFDCQYDLFGPNVSPLLQAIGVPTTALHGTVPPARDRPNRAEDATPEDRATEEADDVDVRSFLGERFRGVVLRTVGPRPARGRPKPRSSRTLAGTA